MASGLRYQGSVDHDHRTPCFAAGCVPGAAAPGVAPGSRTHPLDRTRVRGFTLIELLVVLVFAGLVMALGIPALQNMIVRNRTEGFTREASMLLQRARLEAIRANRPAVVFLDTTDNELFAFVDVDRSDDFNPTAGEPYRTTDYEVGRATPQRAVNFEDQNGNTPPDSIDGFGADHRAVFQPDGSIDDEGAFRISDARGNHLEVRVAPSATARIEVRKWQNGAWKDFGDPQDPDFETWEWN